jgi:hypothetical protein
MLDERRLRVMVDDQGVIKQVCMAEPYQLFGIDPTALPGVALCRLVDALRDLSPDGSGSAVSRRGSGCSNYGMNEASAARVLQQMAQRSIEHPGVSWRVGVAPALDGPTLQALGPVAPIVVRKNTVSGQRSLSGSL